MARAHPARAFRLGCQASAAGLHLPCSLGVSCARKAAAGARGTTLGASNIMARPANPTAAVSQCGLMEPSLDWASPGERLYSARQQVMKCGTPYSHNEVPTAACRTAPATPILHRALEPAVPPLPLAHRAPGASAATSPPRGASGKEGPTRACPKLPSACGDAR